ncbi:DNA-binding response regulator [Romboutsia weinsteinii]|uniref:DNA-binding response regulator n=1 Tax=Romboutsia weinsteinii TaxID=2020949 RepID=A0A371J997_9FIRM|nr:CD3324 family protein [Romboutsia weinsteinii]RDY29331.1 DNA-binding response regulator [Romboutsia weinsteinii]
MKYEKAQNILPKDIIELLQEYIDGGYLYIPRKSDNKKVWGETSGLKSELKERNIEIFNKYSKGLSVRELSKEYYLSENSIRRIIRQQKIIDNTIDT